MGNGNLVVQVGDLDVSERGLDLSFARTYNSQSRHDGNNDDGSTPSVFGNGWTNTYDAHLAYSSTYNVISVYDVDGARYDYSANGNGGWVPPPGQFAQLTYDGSCGYNWTQTDGSNYHFEAPMAQPSGCSEQIPGGLQGRLIAVSGRNANNNVTLSYSWSAGDPNGDNPEDLSQIVVTHSDDQALTLDFGPVNGSGPTELASITRPDGQEITYSYDSTGDLTEVSRPGNNVAATLSEEYTYTPGSYPYLLEDVLSPRYVFSSGSDGAQTTFCFDSTADCQNSPAGREVTAIIDVANVNPTPSDGMNTPLQSTATYGSGVEAFRTETFVYSSGSGYETTDVSDSDGHARDWTLDPLWRPTELQVCTNTCNGSGWLVSYAAWDSNNDLIATTDARDYETDYAYDSNGNLIATAGPEVSLLGYRPTTLYSYDIVNGVNFNNVLAICDPVKTNDLGIDWGDSPPSGDSLCPSQSGTTQFAWSYSDANEPYGQLVSATTANGYTYDIQYSTSAQGGDFGLPTEVAGATEITQNDGSDRTPQESITYDAYGDIASASNGIGTTTASYDDLNRLHSVTDPDDSSTQYTYYSDGSVEKLETPLQLGIVSTLRGTGNCGYFSCSSLDYGTTYDYDADGNQTDVSAWTGGYSTGSGGVSYPESPAKTQRFYDGEDRLVETVAPQDNATFYGTTAQTDDDLYTNPWITRYIYDLSENGNVGGLPTFGGQSVTAHGNVYETQELLPPLSGGTTVSETQSGATPPPIANTQFQETTGTAYDALDRVTAQLRYPIGGSIGSGGGGGSSGGGGGGSPTETQFTYDATNDSLGMLSERCNGASQCVTVNYDEAGDLIRLASSDGSVPTEGAVYNADGRLTAISSTTFGTQYYAYDSDGNVTSSEEPSQSGVTSPATLTYHYYADDARSSLDVSSSGLSQTGLLEYSYFTDSTLKQLVLQDSADSNVGTITIAYTRDNAGNVTQRTESGGGGQLQNCSGNCSTGLNPSIDATNYTYNQNPTDAATLSWTIEDMPAAFRQMVYSQWDPAGNILGDSEAYYKNANLTNQIGSTGYNTYEVDLNGRLAGSANGSAPSTYYANGLAVPVGNTTSETWDARNGVMLSTSFGYGAGLNAKYDAAGRLSSASLPDPYDSETLYSMSATYDALDHLLGEAIDNGNGQPLGSSTYQWGPNGHPFLVGSAASGSQTEYDTLHWDGNQILFTTNRSGEVDDIKVGALGDITPLDTKFSGFTIWDRDISGTAIACHNATGAGGNGVAAPWTFQTTQPKSYNSPCSMQGSDAPGWSIPWTEFPNSIVWTQVGGNELFNGTVSLVGNGGVIGMPRTDGFTDGFTTVQGVRTYDGLVGTWMEPDPAGLEQAYTYDNNNPLTYVDLSGSDPTVSGSETGPSGDDNSNNYPYGNQEGSQADPCPPGLLWDPELGTCTDAIATAPGPYLSPAPTGVSYVSMAVVLRHGCVEGGEPRDVTLPRGGYTPEYLAAVRNGNSIVGIARMISLVTHNGPYNYNQYRQRQYSSTANFGLGVYAYGANIGIGYMFEMIAQYGYSDGDSSHTIYQDQIFALGGLQWAYQHCHP